MGASVARPRPLCRHQRLRERQPAHRVGIARLAGQWLDLAPSAGTNGYQHDRRRTAWEYRDWVIRALNKNMPFTEFPIDQIAGDMLPHPTNDQLIATGFNRNTMLNQEGRVD